MARKLILVVIGVVVSVFVALLLMPRGHPPEYEGLTTGRFNVLMMAQATFHKTDFYKAGYLQYANPKAGRGMEDLYELPDGSEVNLIDRGLAHAIRDGTPYHGYLFFEVPCPDYAHHFAACAVPAAYDRTGRTVFYVDESGAVYRIDPPSRPSETTQKPLLPLDESHAP